MQDELDEPDLSDDELVAAWCAGDSSAFSRLVDRYGPSLLAFLTSLVGDQRLAEDAWSETFLRAVRARDKYRPDGKFRAWLFTIARRCGKDALRSRRRWFNLALKLWEAPTAPSLGSPESNLIESERAQRLHSAMARLPEKHRSILLLTYQQGMDSLEVGAVLGLSSQQIRSRITYARRLLARELEEP